MSVVLELTNKKITKSEVLYGVSWEMYERLLEKYWGLPSPKFTYDSGILEIYMPNSDRHEEDNRILARLVETILLEWEIDFRNFGSMTYKRKNIRKGFEPDTCFFVQSVEKIEGQETIDLEQDSPDLIIEINKTSSSVPRMPIFAAFKVPEVWRLAKHQVKFYRLEEGVYLETEFSLALPRLSSLKATEFLSEAKKTKTTDWVKSVREWALQSSKK